MKEIWLQVLPLAEKPRGIAFIPSVRFLGEIVSNLIPGIHVSVSGYVNNNNNNNNNKFISNKAWLTKLVPAIKEGYSKRVQEKKENSMNIYTYIKRTIIEAIEWVLTVIFSSISWQIHWFICRTKLQKPVLCRGISPCDSFGDAIPYHFLELLRLVEGNWVLNLFLKNSPIVQFDTTPTRLSLTRIPKMSNKNAGIS